MFVYLVCYIDTFDGDIIDILKVFKTYYDAQAFLESNKRFYSNLCISTIRIEWIKAIEKNVKFYILFFRNKSPAPPRRNFLLYHIPAHFVKHFHSWFLTNFFPGTPLISSFCLLFNTLGFAIIHNVIRNEQTVFGHFPLKQKIKITIDKSKKIIYNIYIR